MPTRGTSSRHTHYWLRKFSWKFRRCENLLTIFSILTEFSVFTNYLYVNTLNYDAEQKLQTTNKTIKRFYETINLSKVKRTKEESSAH